MKIVFKILILLTAYCLLLTANAQTLGNTNLYLVRGDAKEFELTYYGDVTAYELLFVVKADTAISSPRLIQKKNTIAGGSQDEIVAAYRAPFTKIKIKFYPIDTEDLLRNRYYFDLTRTDPLDSTDHQHLFIGYLNLQPTISTPGDGSNIPLDGTRFYFAGLDSSNKEPGIPIFRDSDNSMEYLSYEEMAESLGTAGISQLNNLETRFETDSGKVRQDISDSLAKNLVTEAYNLFSVTKQYPIAEDIILFRQKEGVRIDSVLVIVSGTSPSLKFNLEHGTLASPDSLFSTDQTANSTTGQTFSVNDFDEDTLLVNEWIVLQINTVSGVTSFTAVFYWTPLSASTYVPVRTSPSEYVDSYAQENNLIDFLHGGRNCYQYDNTSGSLSHSGFLDVSSGLEIDTTYVDPKFHDAFVFKTVGDTAIPKFVDAFTRNNIFTFAGEHYAGIYDTTINELNAVIGFWVYRPDLNGNGIIFCDIGGGQNIISGANLSVKGYTSNWFGQQLLHVTEVDGDYSHITYYAYKYFHNTAIWFTLSIYNSNADSVSQLRILNPTLIYNKNIDPYYRYKSTAEKNNSRWIGKKILFSGDSQFNDGSFALELSKLTGANLYDHHYGGYRMKYSSTSWFYQDTIKTKMFDAPDIDIYILPFSSNDGFGGGSLRQSAIDSVKYFYTFYGENPDTSTAKLSRFAALSEGDKATIFNYKQTFATFIEQILDTNKTASIIICSIPDGAGSGTMTGDTTALGYGIWAPGFDADSVYILNGEGYQTKRNDQLELRDRYALYFADCRNEVGLTFWNMTKYISDGVHWNNEIDKRMAYSVYQTMLRVK